MDHFYIYHLDPTRQYDIEGDRSSHEDYTLAFELPPRAAGVKRTNARLSSMGSFVRCNHTPDRKSKQTPFLYDSTSAVVTIHYVHTSWERTRIREGFLLLVSLEAIMCRARLASNAEGEDERIIPWKEWGPQGSRLIQMNARPAWTTALGTKCAMVYHDDPYGSRGSLRLRVVLLDVHPCAALNVTGAQEDRHRDGRLIFADRIGESSMTCPSDVHTTLPYRLTVRDLTVEGATHPIDCWLTEDGLAVFALGGSTGGHSAGGIYGPSI